MRRNFSCKMSLIRTWSDCTLAPSGSHSPFAQYMELRALLRRELFHFPSVSSGHGVKSFLHLSAWPPKACTAPLYLSILSHPTRVAQPHRRNSRMKRATCECINTFISNLRPSHYRISNPKNRSTLHSYIRIHKCINILSVHVCTERIFTFMYVLRMNLCITLQRLK